MLGCPARAISGKQASFGDPVWDGRGSWQWVISNAGNEDLSGFTTPQGYQCAAYLYDQRTPAVVLSDVNLNAGSKPQGSETIADDAPATESGNGAIFASVHF